MQMMKIAFLASPPLKNHLKKPSIRPPSFPSMCRVYVYLLRAAPPRPPNYSLRSPSTTQLAPSTKAGFRNMKLLTWRVENYRKNLGADKVQVHLSEVSYTLNMEAGFNRPWEGHFALRTNGFPRPC